MLDYKASAIRVLPAMLRFVVVVCLFCFVVVVIFISAAVCEFTHPPGYEASTITKVYHVHNVPSFISVAVCKCTHQPGYKASAINVLQ